MEVRVKFRKAPSMPGAPHRYPNCSDALGAYYTRTGRIYTGLTPEDEKRLGDALGYDLRSGSSFWDSFRIRISSETIVLKPEEDPMDELKYLFLKSHKYVAASITDMSKPNATYYLSIAEEEAKVSNEYNKVKRNAYREFDKMKPEDVKKCLRIYGYSTDAISDSVAEDRLMTLIENNPLNFFKRWVDNKVRASEFLLKEGVSKNIIRKNKNIYTYGATTLGYTLEDAIAYIDSPENSDIKTTIINEINGK